MNIFQLLGTASLWALFSSLPWFWGFVLKQREVSMWNTNHNLYFVSHSESRQREEKGRPEKKEVVRKRETQPGEDGEPNADPEVEQQFPWEAESAISSDRTPQTVPLRSYSSDRTPQIVPLTLHPSDRTPQTVPLRPHPSHYTPQTVPLRPYPSDPLLRDGAGAKGVMLLPFSQKTLVCKNTPFPNKMLL